MEKKNIYNKSSVAQYSLRTLEYKQLPESLMITRCTCNQQLCCTEPRGKS